MSKFTPGPWSYDSDENEVHSDSMQESGGDPAHICEMIGTNWAANGRLIAAAPELYEFTKKVQELLTCGEGTLRAEGRCNELLCEILLMVPANIIAKAEGK
jgi:hypothetical protein